MITRQTPAISACQALSCSPVPPGRSAARSRPGLLSAGSDVLGLARNRERTAQNRLICA